MRVFPVSLPSGQRYWTVLDEDLQVVGVADEYLRHLRFGRDAAESTTKAYAHSIALFLRWCARSGRSWQAGVERFALFMAWLAHARPSVDNAASVVVAGPGAAAVRCPSRINGVLTAVRGMAVHAVATGHGPAGLVSMLYEVADDRDLPAEARGEDGRMAWRMRARHRLREPETTIDRASDEQIVALLRACRSARDRLIVLLMARAGLRRGEVCGLRRSDVHLLVDSRRLGCDVARAHLHVVRRDDNPNQAWAKSRRQRVAPRSGERAYAASARAHSETVLRCFYEFHLAVGDGPIVNPFPLDRSRRGRAHAHHNPMEPYRNQRRGLYRPNLPSRIPRAVTDEEFNEIFAKLPSHRDRALVAFYVSTGARASELLSATQGGVAPGRQLITVVRKGTRAKQELPASTDAFVWLRLYQLEMGLY
jgi:integrase